VHDAYLPFYENLHLPKILTLHLIVLKDVIFNLVLLSWTNIELSGNHLLIYDFQASRKSGMLKFQYSKILWITEW
jgi:hypothetical protein